MLTDSGLFQCVASNPAGNIQASASLKVLSTGLYFFSFYDNVRVAISVTFIIVTVQARVAPFLIIFTNYLTYLWITLIFFLQNFTLNCCMVNCEN